MPRTPRRCQWTEEACYHLMDRGHNRELKIENWGQFSKLLDLQEVASKLVRGQRRPSGRSLRCHVGPAERSGPMQPATMS
jgi:hypothetical protein